MHISVITADLFNESRGIKITPLSGDHVPSSEVLSDLHKALPRGGMIYRRNV